MENNLPAELPSDPPKVVWWFKVYASFLCVIYLLTTGASFLCFLIDPAELEMSKSSATFLGSMLFALGVGLFIACLLPLLLPPRPWVWIYDLLIICIGMTSVCTLVASIPLLIFWIRPETQRYFGRNQPPPASVP